MAIYDDPYDGQKRLTIALYNKTYSQVVELVGCFSNSGDASYYRDHSNLAYLPTKLEYLYDGETYRETE